MKQYTLQIISIGFDTCLRRKPGEVEKKAKKAEMSYDTF